MSYLLYKDFHTLLSLSQFSQGMDTIVMLLTCHQQYQGNPENSRFHPYHPYMCAGKYHRYESHLLANMGGWCKSYCLEHLVAYR